MSIAAMEKDTAELFYWNTTSVSGSGEKRGAWTSEGTFNCAVGNSSGPVNMTTLGKVFSDRRILSTTASKSFTEGKRILIENKYWEIVDIMPAKSRYGCGATLFTRLSLREIVSS